jgi:streptogramin lyase
VNTDSIPQKLWVVSPGAGKVLGFANTQLVSANPAPAPASFVNSSSPEGIAIDRDGNIWVGDVNAKKIFVYPPDQQNSPTPTPLRTISSQVIDGFTTLGSITGLAFDAAGNLWVAGGSKLEKYNRASVLATPPSNPTPSVLLQMNASASTGLAFDAAGNLYVGSYSDSKISKLLANQLTTSGSVAANLEFSLASAGQLAFDSQNNLWAAACNGFVAKFTPSQLNQTGVQTIEPDVKLTPGGCPEGVAFDRQGDLWVMDYPSRLIKFNKANLSVSSNPSTPDVIMQPIDSVFWGQIAFFPAASNLPIYK